MEEQRPDGTVNPSFDTRGVRAEIESRLLRNNITVTDDAELKNVLARLTNSERTGVHTTATTKDEYQPAATHGIVINVKEDPGIMTVLTVGLWPHPISTSARLIDLRTGEVRAAVSAKSRGNIWTSNGVYRGARRVADRIADTLARIQTSSRHLNPKNWPTNYQRDSSDPSAQGRYTHAIYLRMQGSDDQALEALKEAIALDPNLAAKARSAWEFEVLRADERFKTITEQP